MVVPPVFQCVAVCYSVLQCEPRTLLLQVPTACGALWCIMVHYGAAWCRVLQYDQRTLLMLQIAVPPVLQCVAVHCIV